MIALIFALITTGLPEVSEHVARAPDATEQYILSLKPNIGTARAKRLGKLIDYWADHYDVDPDLMVAIIRVESYFEPNTKACWPSPYKKDAITCDHGLAQINEVWVEKWMLDAEKLVTDDGYNIYVQARLLSWLKRYYGEEQDWYGRYHSNTPNRKALYLSKLENYGYASR